jgi:oxygen-independent coproporphyrinogen-3 oxidase
VDEVSLYAHVPFCAQKCHYCAFYSETGNAALMQRFTDALCHEMELVEFPVKPRTIFFGGGTPSLLTLAQWRQIFTALDHHGLLDAAPEFTIECNPATVSADKARLFLDHGVNRVSMGVQSLDESLLDRLGRVHSRAMVFKSYDTLRRAGFQNLNLDLMFAIPTQTLAMWKATLDEAVAMQPEHLSSYEVIYEDDTPLFHQLQAGEFDVDEELACAMYDTLLETTAAAGLRQYEIANFARDDASSPVRSAAQPPARACRHNIAYWRAAGCHALGPSATEYLGGVRTRNVASTPLYCDAILDRGTRPVESREELTPLRRAGENAAFGLRMVAGWPYDLFRRRTGFDLRSEWREEIAGLCARGWGIADEEGFRLTPVGLRFADAAAAQFLR